MEVAAVSWAMAVQRFVWCVHCSQCFVAFRPSWSTAATCPTLRGLNLRGSLDDCKENALCLRLASIAWSWTILQFGTDVLHRVRELGERSYATKVAEQSNEQIEAHRRAEGPFYSISFKLCYAAVPPPISSHAKTFFLLFFC